MSSALTRQRAILARLGLDALRGIASEQAYYPSESLDYNMILIRAYIGYRFLHGHKTQTTSQIARGLHLPRTTVLRHLHRLETAGVIGRDGTGYYPTNPPGTEHGVQLVVNLILRAAKDLSKVGHQNPSSDGQQTAA